MLIAGFPAGPWGTNCYVVATGPGAECVVVDPGKDAAAGVAEVVREHRLKPVSVLVSHGHIDHMWCVAPVAGSYDATAWIHPRDRHLLTDPKQPLATVKPKRVTAHIASLKWSRPEYAAQLKKTMGVDYTKQPSEDFASVMIEFETADGTIALGEATTSWSYVGAGLRLSAELLGPEYSMRWNSLDSGLELFFSREVKGKAGEDLVEKQNAEVG